MKGKVISMMSFKGGVGKTICTINLGAAFAKLGKKVLVVDGNFLSPSLNIYLGLLEPEKTLKEVLRDGIGYQNAVYEHTAGIHILPCNFYKSLDLHKFSDLVTELQGAYDYIILDSGPSYTEEVIAILLVSDIIYFVTTPDYPTLAMTLRASNLAKYKDVTIGGIILNRIKGRRFELSQKEIEDSTKLTVVARIREDSKIQVSSSKFRPIVYARPWRKSSREFINLAKRIIKDSTA